MISHVASVQRLIASAIAVGLLGALASCSGAQTSAPAQPRADSSPLQAAPTAAEFPTPSGRPPYTPAPSLTQPPGVNAGSPPVTYATPAGYSLDLSTPQSVDLTSVTGAEKLSFSLDPSTEDLSHPAGTMTVAGEPGVVVTRGPVAGGYGYEELVILRHAGVQYEAECLGYSGYDAARLSNGCSEFLTSLGFVH